MSWTPSFRGFFSSCTDSPSPSRNARLGTRQGSPRGQGPEWSSPRALPQPPTSQTRPHRGPNPSAHLSLHRKFPVLGEAEGEAAEDAGRGGGRPSVALGLALPPPPTQGPRAGSAPELTLDLDPAGAAQEGPGLVPLLHGGQAGAQHLQPQVQHLLAAMGTRGPSTGFPEAWEFLPRGAGLGHQPLPTTQASSSGDPTSFTLSPSLWLPTLGDTVGPMASTPLSPVTALRI